MPGRVGGLLARLPGVLRSPWVRAAFLVLALALAAVYLVRERAAIAEAWDRLDPAALLPALLLSVANVALAGASWRAVLADLGSPLPWRGAARVFFVGQLGRYVPGTVLQFVAQAELARDLGVPRRRTGAALVVALMVSMTTAGLLVVGVLPSAVSGSSPASAGVPVRVGWLVWLLPLLGVLLVPTVLNRLLGVLLRVARREPLEHPVTVRGLAVSAAWALASWLAVGLQVFVLVHALGGGWPTSRLLALAVGGYALAWVAGFLVVLAPAGAGARELVLAAVVALAVGGGGAAVVVLASRVLLTVADLLLALTALAVSPGTLARVRGAR